MSRWQAFAIHFTCSAIVLLLLLATIMFLWFPGILFNVDGGWAGLRIVMGVDLVLGPLMTLIVFKSGKPGLKFDLTAIVSFQLICLSIGTWIVYSERPLALVLAHDTVYSIAKQEFVEYGKDPAVLDQYPGPYPKLVYTEMPENDIAADIAAIRAQFIGDPLYIQTDLYRALPAEGLESVFRRAAQTRRSVSDELQSQLSGNCMFAKFVSSVTSGFVCFNTSEEIYTEFYSNEYTRETPSITEPISEEANEVSDV